ncbi:MAG TPA: hypothetical protein VLT36_22035 [Candidatus Dormibacteraeota bacterium]|nr:hypothetical protein [Candidatus Dormibacteraeota bacterium]
MGIDYNEALLLADAVKKGVSLKEVITIGHLNLGIKPATPREIFARAGVGSAELCGPDAENARFVDGLLKGLGATRTSALDASPYEGAELLHDLNTPLPDPLKNSCDTLIDGGSLEHIFNAPVALQNYIDLVRPGGHLLIFTAGNNQFGHGFYQFSAELFFRVFTRENGMEVSRIVVYEIPRNAPMYQVLDPAAVGCRSELVTSLPTVIFVVAKKVANVPVFANWPQQADYTQTWKEHAAGENNKGQSSGKGGGFIANAARRLPYALQKPIHRWYNIKRRLRRTFDSGPCFRRYNLFEQ